MRILIAEDDLVSRRLLRNNLIGWGYEVVVAEDGAAAWRLFQDGEPPALAILDWNMPGMDGLEVCRLIRATQHGRQATYLILLTGRGSREDIVAGLEGGADDYILKPFDPEELHARLRAGLRIVDLQRNLAERVRELESALQQVKQLQGLLPICMYCKRIRDDQNYWQQLEHYLATHSAARFSHGICPSCFEAVVQPELKRLNVKADPSAHPTFHSHAPSLDPTAGPKTGSEGAGS
ncbi:MAG TPA: response regulator transcription factor [Gemmataceae bacterium]|nr:response regulator transcription factor [Gemmataceae bacterium]